MPSHQTSQPRPQAPSVGLSQSSSTKRMSCRSDVDADGGERAEVDVLQVGRRGFDDHLELVVVLPAVGAVAVAAVGRAARGLDVGGGPGRGAEGAQRGGRVEGAGADLHVVGLQDGAALRRPVGLQAQDDLLEAARGVGGHGARVRSGRRAFTQRRRRGQSRPAAPGRSPKHRRGRQRRSLAAGRPWRRVGVARVGKAAPAPRGGGVTGFDAGQGQAAPCWGGR